MEKHATHVSLKSENFHIKFKCLIVTGRGYADFATRKFEKRVRSVLEIPAFGLVDCDPHGFNIFFYGI